MKWLCLIAALCPLLALLCTAERSMDKLEEEINELLEFKSELELQVKKLVGEITRLEDSKKTGKGSCKASSKTCPPCPKVPETPAVQDEPSKMLASLSDLSKRSPRSARFLGKYPFKTKPLKSIQANDPKIIKMLREGRPVLIKNSNLVKPAVEKWDAEFLASNIGGRNLAVQVSNTRQFLYYASDDDPQFEWEPPFERVPGVFPDFIAAVEELEQKRNGTYSYFHNDLNGLSQGLTMREDFEQFNWKWIEKVKPKHWGKLDTNLFILGMPDVVTPAHYDGLQNFFAQIRGFKRCILFSPGNFRYLYPHPVGHPSDRQTQIDFDHPNLAIFPRFPEAQGLEVIVGPGDVLFIPTHWYHYIESEMDSMTMSMNFWFTTSNNTDYKPAVPPKFKTDTDKEEAKDVKKETKPSLDNDEEEEDENPLAGGIKLEVPPDTYLIDEITELELVREVERAIGLTIGPSKVKAFLRDGYDSRFDMVKYKPDVEDGTHTQADTGRSKEYRLASRKADDDDEAATDTEVKDRSHTYSRKANQDEEDEDDDLADIDSNPNDEGQSSKQSKPNKITSDETKATDDEDSSDLGENDEYGDEDDEDF